jgi:alpha-L-fucosidase
LDGGWVRPHDTINDEVRSWGYDISKWEQDIDMPRIAQMARRHQPGILIVDRTVHGLFENYRTPEQRVPDHILPYPWETCMTMTRSWGYNKNPEYKSTRQLIHTLVGVAAKGGNFLLNVGPTPQGTIEPEAYRRLEEIGRWMTVNGPGIYATRPWTSFGEGEHIRFTASKDREYVYVFLLKWPGDSIGLTSIKAKKGSKVVMLGHGRSLNWEMKDDRLIIRLPETLQAEENRPCRHAWAFRLEISRN